MIRWGRRVIIFVIIFLIGGVIISFFSQPRIKDNSFLVIDISGDILEDAPEGTIEKLLEGEKITIKNIRENIEKAKVDERIKGVIIRVASSSMGWGKIQEIRETLFDFKKSGKVLVSYLEEGEDKEYYLSTAATKIFSPPVAMVMVDGLSVSGLFIRGLLDKVGIYPDFEVIEKYKTSVDILKRNKMSEEGREMLNSILDSTFETIIEDISFARKKTKEEIVAIINEGVFSSRDALKYGLLDKIAYFDEVKKILKKENNNQFKKVDFFDYLAVSPKSLGLQKGPKIALIYATGAIISGESTTHPLFGKTVGSKTISEIIEDVRKDKDIKAMVLRVDSPGGSASASDMINREIILARRQKPIVVSMSDVAGSGGYYISCSATKIVAQPTTLTGSIGVIFGKFNLKKLYEKIGINKESISRGKYAETFSETKNFTLAERERIKKHLWDFYFNDFLKSVSEGRGIKKEELDKISRGRIWTGKQAKERGLIDEIGGMQKALQLAKKEAKIADDISCEIVIYREKGYWTKLLERLIDKTSSLLPSELRNLKIKDIFLSDKVLTIIPYEIKIR